MQLYFDKSFWSSTNLYRSKPVHCMYVVLRSSLCPSFEWKHWCLDLCVGHRAPKRYYHGGGQKPQKASQHDLVGGGLIKKVKNLLICVTCCSMLDKSSFVCYVQIASFFLNKTSIEWTSILFLNIPHRVHSSRVHRLGSSQKSIWNEPYPNLAVDRFPGPNNKKTPKRVTGWFRDIPLGVMGMNPLWALERWQKHTWDMPMAQRKRLAIRKVMGWNGTSKMLWRHSYLDIFNICEPDDVILSLQVLL